MTTTTTIPHAGRYDRDQHATILTQLEEGDIAYLSYSGDYGTRHRHLRVDTVTETGAAFENDVTLHLIDDEISLQIRGRTTDYDGREYSLYRIERYPKAIIDTLSKWEVHLCYNLVEESSDDECQTVYARTREEAIEFAQRRSETNPPEVGPVYETGEVTA